MKTYLEHANITVPNIDEAIAFLTTIDPTFRVRHDETPKDSYRWAHVGHSDFYIALQEPHDSDLENLEIRKYQDVGINHLAWVVQDVDSVAIRLKEKGFREGITAPPHPHRKRRYFFDSFGLEWEVVEYLSDIESERNQYPV
ncbi:MAG: VOC family protein [Pseudobacteriovorax sp.]|nr:VOC family protein [Pseudobacteriovorax sp.]